MAEKTDVRKRYAELEKKHRLPNYDFLDAEFEISTIEDEKFLLREIRRRMHDKTEGICKMLDSILQPEATLHAMYEAGAFSDEEKKNIYRLYKELMSSHRASLALEVQADDAMDAKFIRDFSEKWKKAKEEALMIFRKLEECWTKDSEREEKLGYFG
jgi:hypothetical protein